MTSDMIERRRSVIAWAAGAAIFALGFWWGSVWFGDGGTTLPNGDELSSTSAEPSPTVSVVTTAEVSESPTRATELADVDESILLTGSVVLVQALGPDLATIQMKVASARPRAFSGQFITGATIFVTDHPGECIGRGVVSAPILAVVTMSDDRLVPVGPGSLALTNDKGAGYLDVMTCEPVLDGYFVGLLRLLSED